MQLVKLGKLAIGALAFAVVVAGYNNCADTQVDRPALRSPVPAEEPLATDDEVPLSQTPAPFQMIALTGVEPPEIEADPVDTVVPTRTIRLRGDGFDEDRIVLVVVGGQQCTNIKVISSREFTCDLAGPCPAGEVDIQITTNLQEIIRSTQRLRCRTRATPTPSPTPTPTPDPAQACAQAGGTAAAKSCRFTRNGSYTLNLVATVPGAEITVIGAGGGLGAHNHSNWNGYGGAGGGAAIKTLTLAAGAYNIALGKGGTSIASWGNNPGTLGGASSFSGGSLNLAASGGFGGASIAAVIAGTPAQGGSGSGGDLNCKGGNGLVGRYNYGNGQAGECSGGVGGAGYAGGGASQYGGAGLGSPPNINGAGPAGCGAGSGTFSTPGADGCVIITWQ